MAAWHRSRRADIALRASGLILCSLAYLAIAQLTALPIAPQSPGLFAHALAAIGFVGGSAGSALAALGHHLFDQIIVGAPSEHRGRSCSDVIQCREWI